MAKQSSKHRQAVVQYYDKTRAEYRLIWRTNRNLGLHFGYYDAGHQEHDAAILNMNAQLAQHAGITANDVVLDAGCGVGGSAIWLAEHIGCQTTGINLVPLQIEKARHYAHEHGVADLTQFKIADFSDTGFDTASFTVVWGLESIVHAEDKQAVVNEAYRLLQPGGRLLISEYLLKDEPLNGQEQMLLNTWLNGWEMPSLMTETQYRAMSAAAGFSTVSVEDWTDHVMPSLMRIKRFAKLIGKVSPLMHALHIVNENQTGNRAAAQAQMELLESSAWRYKVVLMTK